MTYWNCRMVALNGEPVGLPWKPVHAHNPECAAVAYCGDASVWEEAKWENGANAIVEVEEMGGESGVHRMAISAYDQLQFSATPEDEA